MKYINSDMLRHLFEVWKEIEEKAGNDKGAYCYNECINAIDKMPYDDVVEVKYGHWKLDGTCSVCGKHTLQSYGSFCCYCGADMRERNEMTDKEKLDLLEGYVMMLLNNSPDLNLREDRFNKVDCAYFEGEADALNKVRNFIEYGLKKGETE